MDWHEATGQGTNGRLAEGARCRQVEIMLRQLGTKFKAGLCRLDLGCPIEAVGIERRMEGLEAIGIGTTGRLAEGARLRQVEPGTTGRLAEGAHWSQVETGNLRKWKLRLCAAALGARVVGRPHGAAGAAKWRVLIWGGPLQCV